MSEFDKEAERRRLREKYESEAEDRETTERMSQLLLQGATMTNHHCDDCGTPIFRYQGQEFCPTCQAEAQAAQGVEGAQGTDEAAETQPQGGTGAASTAEQQPAVGDPGATQAPTPRRESTPAVQTPTETAVEPAEDADLGDAGEALASTIATLAARAEQTDDPRRAREFLEAAHEAAETLATLQR